MNVTKRMTTLDAEVCSRLRSSGADIVAVPGVPGRESDPALPANTYPVITSDVLKLLREAGLRTQHLRQDGDKARLAQKSHELWLPILAFARDAAVGGAGGVLTAAALALLGQRDRANQMLHVRVGRPAKSSSGMDWFSADAPDAVLGSLRQFLEATEDGSKH
jgi:hypothetical protein